jgi:predicted GIY-YIG superfamily endonuclease
MEIPKPSVNAYHFCAKIYRICSSYTDKVYYGSTTADLKNRLQIHQKHYEKYLIGKFSNYISSFELMRYDDAYIELVEVVYCENKNELSYRESQWILLDPNRVNIRLPGKLFRKAIEDYEKNVYIIKKCQIHHQNQIQSVPSAALNVKS